MADSNITVTSLVATSGVGANLITVTTAGGGPSDCLSYLGLQKVEIWASATNNRGSATLVGTTGTSTLPHGGLGASTTRYYWARAVDNSNLTGEWYPLSATAGIAATTSNQVPPNNSVGTPQIQDGAVTTAKVGTAQITTALIADAQITNAKIGNLAVTDAKIQSMSADKITAGTITATISMTSPNITGGRLNISSVSYAFPVVYINGLMGSGLNSVWIYQNGNDSESAIISDHAGTGVTCHGLRARQRSVGRPSSQWWSGIVGAANGYAFYAETGGYGPFTGQHSGLMDKDTPEFPMGSIVVDREVVARRGIDDTLTRVELSSVAKDPAAVGVVTYRAPFKAYDAMAALGHQPTAETINFDQTASTPQERLAAGMLKRRQIARAYDHLVINSVGEGLLLVCGRGGDLAAGDLVCTSTLRGVGMRQPDFDLGEAAAQLVTNYTVARVREAVTFAHPDEVKLVACIYLCG